MATEEGQARHLDCLEYRQRLWQRPLSRKDAFKGAMGVVATGSASSHLLLNSSVLERLGAVRAGAVPQANVLVIINQSGGNDGLNMVVPYSSQRYYKARPSLAVPAQKVLPLDSSTGLHPTMGGLKQLFMSGHLAVLQGVGYPNPDLSHFNSIIYWQTARTSGQADSGWLGRYLDTALAQDQNPLKAITIGYALPMAFLSKDNATPALQNLPDFQLWTDSDGAFRKRTLQAFREMNSGQEQNPTYAAIRTAQLTTQRAVDVLQTVPTGYQAKTEYPKTDLAKQMRLVAQLIHANLGTRVFWVEQDGYDDHAAEAVDHAKLLRELDGAISALYGDIAAHGWDQKVMIMTWSEFGRRVEENGNRGTDHGTAAPMLLVGGSVKGGVYGQDPVLAHLDPDGNLVYRIDFRSVYRTILERWLGADSLPVLGRSYETLPFL